MEIAIITCLRRQLALDQQYVHRTMYELRTSWPLLPTIRLYPGTPSDDYLREHLDDAELRPISFGLWERIKLKWGPSRAAGNFMRALSDGNDDLMIFEDDIVIKPGWYQALVAIRRQYDPRTMPLVTFYSAIDYRPHVRGAAYQGDFVPPKPIEHHGSSLGLFVPRAHRLLLADFTNASLEDKMPFDAIVDQYINTSDTAQLAVTIPSYVDHRGLISAIEENAAHGPRRAPMF